jgi:hypothetical protein
MTCRDSFSNVKSIENSKISNPCQPENLLVRRLHLILLHAELGKSVASLAAITQALLVPRVLPKAPKFRISGLVSLGL